MPAIKQLFDQNKVDSLKRYLQKENTKGRMKDYEIIVDNFKVVPRTNDISEFDDYEPEINDNTQKLCILIYDGLKTNRNTNYTFYLQGEIPPDDTDRDRDRDRDRDMVSDRDKVTDRDNFRQYKSVNGLGEIEQIIQDRLDAKDKEYEIRRLSDLLADKTEKLRDAEIYNEKIEAQVEKLLIELDELKKSKVAAILKKTDLGGKLVQQAFSGFLKSIPAVAGLGSLFEVQTDNPKTEALNQPANEESTASFERAEPENASNGNLMQYIKLLESKFNEQEREEILAIVNYLSDNTRRIETVLTFLKIKND